MGARTHLPSLGHRGHHEGVVSARVKLRHGGYVVGVVHVHLSMRRLNLSVRDHVPGERAVFQ